MASSVPPQSLPTLPAPEGEDEAMQSIAEQEASAADADEASIVSEGEEDDDSESVMSASSPRLAGHTAGAEHTEPASTKSTLPVEIWERILINVPPTSMDRMSQISQQHQAITKNPYFRARYFYHRHMPCQAVYYATCRPKLFSSEVLQGLLSLGAVMSRYLCQSVLQRHVSMDKTRAMGRLSAGLSTTGLLALMNEGHRQYGDTLKLASSDGTEIKAWADSLSRQPTMTDSIREKFVNGKFAVFNNDDAVFQPPYTPTTPLANTVAYHPELLQIMLANGYEHDKEEQDRIVVCICQKFADKEDELYERLDSLLTQYPDWNMRAQSRHLVDYVTTPNSVNFAPVPASDIGKALLLKYDGIGPIRAPLKVMKRLFDEGRAFLDLEMAVSSYVSKECFKMERRPLRCAAPPSRILAYLFPSSIESCKVEIATTYVCHFEQEFKDVTAIELSNGMDMLFKLLDELQMTKQEWLKLVMDNDLAYDKFLVATVKRGYFGNVESMNEEDKSTLISQLAICCIEEPMSGHHIEAIEAAAKELYANEKSRNKKVNTYIAISLDDSLLQWQFNLDTLKPDRKHAVDAKLRSPIAWLTKGQFTVTNSSYSPHSTLNPDPYALFPLISRPRHGNELVNLSFICPHALLRGAESKDTALSQTKKKNAKQPEEAKPTGWQHLGHIDQLEAQANDSGVMIVESAEQKVAEAKDEGVAAVQENERAPVVHSSSAQVTNPTNKQASATAKAGSLSTFNMRVVRSQCAACHRTSHSEHCCGYHPPYHRRAKEMTAVLPLFLPADSPGLRDVVLSHALVNGNVAVIKDLMSGQYGSDPDSEEVKPLSKVSSKQPRLGQPDMPVLPTLAHWRIMQTIERKPVEQFVDRIVEGAPFKRGYVQSSIETRNKEDDVNKRRMWYKTTGHKDDRPMTALFREKERLESIDLALRKRKQAASCKLKAKNKKEDEEADSRAASQAAEVSGRTHLRRSATRKPVRYNESASFSSDEDEDSDMDGIEHDELQVSEMLGSSSNRSKSKAVTMSEGDLFGHGSDLSDLSSDVEDDSDRASNGNVDSETDDDDEEEDRSEINKYGLDEDDVPMVTFEMEEVEKSMALTTLLRRSKSLKLWLDHLRLLLWFERRKERMVKEKAQKAKANGGHWERGGKSKFSLGLSEYIRRIESTETQMQEALQPALKARRLALAQRKKTVKKVVPKVEATRDEEEVAATGKRKSKRSSQGQQLLQQQQPKRKRMKASDYHLDTNEASSSRKRRPMTKQRNETLTTTTT